MLRNTDKLATYSRTKEIPHNYSLLINYYRTFY